MTGKPITRARFVVVVLVILVFWLVCLPVPSVVFKPYDAARLALFSHRIADTDRIVGTFAQDSVSVTLTGEDARKVVQAVSSANPARPRYGTDWACAFMVKATFFKGTNVLDEIELCGSLFLLHYSKPPFLDESELLSAAISNPLSDAHHEARMKELESK